MYFMENNKELEQAKKRMEKIYITDIAIEKVPYIQYKNLSEKQNMIMRQLARDVLSLSKEFNDSNEVAIICDIDADMPLDEYGISYGTEHSVQITSDTLSNHILTSADSVSVVVLHNHPSSQTFSLEDIRFFLVYSTVAVISVVSNQGTVHYLYKDRQYDFHKAFALFKKVAVKVSENPTVKEYYDLALSFLKQCGEVGLFYK